VIRLSVHRRLSEDFRRSKVFGFWKDPLSRGDAPSYEYLLLSEDFRPHRLSQSSSSLGRSESYLRISDLPNEDELATIDEWSDVHSSRGPQRVSRSTVEPSIGIIR